MQLKFGLLGIIRGDYQLFGKLHVGKDVFYEHENRIQHLVTENNLYLCHTLKLKCCSAMKISSFELY